jgi:hypothetical protein
MPSTAYVTSAGPYSREEWTMVSAAGAVFVMWLIVAIYG